MEFMGKDIKKSNGMVERVNGTIKKKYNHY